jgi:hypothetical protein
MLAGTEAVLVLSVQLSIVTSTVTPSLALVTLSTTDTVTADGEENCADKVQLKAVGVLSLAPIQVATTLAAWATPVLALITPAVSKPVAAVQTTRRRIPRIINCLST